MQLGIVCSNDQYIHDADGHSPEVLAVASERLPACGSCPQHALSFGSCEETL